MPENAARQFLDQVQAETAVNDRQRALVGVRAVFYGLMARPPRSDLRRLVGLLPEELETLWKPAFYTCLRDRRERDGGASPGFLELVRRETYAKASDGDEIDPLRMSRAVVEALRSRLSRLDRRTLDEFVPDELEEPAGGVEG